MEEAYLLWPPDASTVLRTAEKSNMFCGFGLLSMDSLFNTASRLLKRRWNQVYTFSAMSETIEAIYEKGIFRPITPVNLPEGTRVFIETDTVQTDAEAQIREQLLADGANPEEVEKIIDNFRQLWSSYDTLTEEQKDFLERSRLDQEKFFESQPSA